MKDKLGKSLKIGDQVVYMVRNHRTLGIGTVIKITEYKVCINTDKSIPNQLHTLYQDPNAVVIVIGDES